MKPFTQLLILAIAAFAMHGNAATYTVTTTADSGPGSLRQAIIDANGNPGADAIHFNIPGAGVHTITPQSFLPVITDAVTIDGYTQPGASPNSLTTSNNAVLLIEVNGSSAANANGFHVGSGFTTIRGLVIHSFPFAGIFNNSGGTNVFEGNFIGTDATGTLDRGNEGNGITCETPGNRIGGANPAARNVISGNNGHGLLAGANRNVIQGNFIGLTRTGLGALGNGGFGVWVPHGSGATGVEIGGPDSGAGNIISGNQRGVVLGGTSNLVHGNFIGTDVTGTLDLGNTEHGVFVQGTGHRVGGAEPGARNIISGNNGHGVFVDFPESSGNSIAGNIIGLNAAGAAALGNGESGVVISFASQNIVGGLAPGERNIVSGNIKDGILIFGSSATNNRVEGNFIGLDAAGAQSFGNGGGAFEEFGLRLNGQASLNLVRSNVISGNLDGGVSVDNAAFSNTVAFNFIGTTPDGLAALANSGSGLIVQSDAHHNVIASNVVSGNAGPGIIIGGSTGTSSNQLIGNFIGTDRAALGPLGNAGNGIEIQTGIANEVGGILLGQGNIVAHNGGAGVVIGAGTRHAVRGNRIFSNTGLGIDLGTAGVTFNDGGTDSDSGPNNLQNFPVFSAALVFANGVTTVSGTLSSAPNASFELDFFASLAGDTSGYGEGQVFVGTASITTGASGSGNFTVTLDSPVPIGRFVTATATDSAGNTSEFSQTRLVQDGDFDDDGLPNNWEVLYGFNPNNRADAYADTDRDGMANIQEYWAGTSPTDSLSVFAFTGANLSANNFCVSWPAELLDIRVQTTSTLDFGGIWSDHAGTPTVQGGDFVLCDPVAGGQRFYRLYSFSSVLAPTWPYSMNIVGYQDRNLVAGSNMVVSPFTSGNNSLGLLIPNPPDGTTLFTNLQSDPLTFFDGDGWLDSNFAAAGNVVLKPGVPFFIFPPTSYALRLFGEVTAPPQILHQSTNQSFVPGTNVILFALATGSAPLSYQWLRDGLPLVGATNLALNIANVFVSDAGNYSVVITNAYGAVTSSVIALRLSGVPTIAASAPPAGSQITSLTQLTVTFSEDVQGIDAADLRINGLPANDVQALSATTYQFSFPQPPSGNVAITWASNHGISAATPSNAAFDGTAPASQWSYNLVAQTGPDITSHPQSQNVVTGSQADLSVVAAGASPLSYQWLFNGTNIINGATQPTLSLADVEPSASGSYGVVVSNSFGVVTSAVATLLVVSPPVITLHPQSQIGFAGANLALTAAAHGSVPLGFQWFRNGQPLVTEVGNQSNSSLTIFNAQSADAGNYHVVITNAANIVGMTSSVATLIVLDPLTLGAQPVGTNVSLGGTATFCVGASGTLPVQYQWRHNGDNIPNATNACLTITNVQLPDGGAYNVAIGNPAGTAVSDDAFLAIDVTATPPGDHFTNRVSLGSALTNAVSGTNRFATIEPGEPLHAGKAGGKSVWYTWTSPANGIATFRTVGSAFDTLLAVYTNSSLATLMNVTADEDSGGFFTSELRFNARAGVAYHIAIDGFSGAEGAFILSWELEPTAETLPQIIAQPSNQTVLEGASATFAVSASGGGLAYQWLFNGALMAGATGSTLTISNVQPENVGFYAVRVSNAAGRVLESDAATLEIGPMASVQSQDKFGDLFAPGALEGAKASGSPGFLSLAAGIPLSLVVNNTNSTTEQSEPVNCRITGASRWLTLRALDSGVCIIDTIGSSIDTTLSVYTGSNYLSLQLVVCDDNGAFDGLRSLAKFTAIAGTDYRLRIDGVGSKGTLRVNSRLGEAPVATPLPSTPPPAALDAPFTLSAPTLLTNSGVTLRYHWFLDGNEIPNATNANYSLGVFAPEHAGRYSVRVENEFGDALYTWPAIKLAVPLLKPAPRIVGGSLQLTVQRPFNQAVQLEGSDDLQTWVPMHTIPLTTPGPEVEVPITMQPRFFRARPWP
jgi:hypothetical protein